MRGVRMRRRGKRGKGRKGGGRGRVRGKRVRGREKGKMGRVRGRGKERCYGVCKAWKAVASDEFFGWFPV